MAKLSQRQVARLWIREGGNPRVARKMAAIAMAESRGDTKVVNSIGATGLFQIHPGGSQYLDAGANTRMAIRKLKTQGLGAWEAYTNGSWKQFIGGGGKAPLGAKRGGRSATHGRTRGRPGISSTPLVDSHLEGQLNTTPGIDRSADRTALKQQYLLGSHGKLPSLNSLLSLNQGLSELQDTPSSQSLSLRRVNTRSSIPGRRGIRGSAGGGGGGGFDLATRAIHLGQAWSASKAPYLWGGGHGGIAKPGDRVDCSGFVSALLGLRSPQVASAFTHWGKPGSGGGRGRVIVFANNGHVLLAARDKHTGKLRWFATSRSNPGGGAGEIARPSQAYLSHFTARHI